MALADDMGAGGEAWDDLRPSPLNFLRFARRADADLLKLDLLLVTAASRLHRLATGSWPSGVDVLVDGGRLTRAERDRVAKALHVGQDEQGGLELVVTLPKPNEDAPGEARVRLSAP